MSGSLYAVVATKKTVFPDDISTSNPYMTLRIKKYSKLGITDDPMYLPVTSIVLPIPNNLKEEVSIVYNHKNLGPIAGQFVQNTTNLGNVFENGASVSSVDKFLEIAGKAATSTAASVAAQAALNLQNSEFGKKVPNVLSAISAATGISINPFMTVLFERPEFKTHTFSWKLTPRKFSESVSLKHIINNLKIAMHPGLIRSFGNVLFTYPYVFELQLNPTDDYLYKFKPVVLKNLKINYASTGVPSFFKGSAPAPTAVEITMTFEEIEIWTREDYRSDEFAANIGAAGQGD